MARPDFAFSLEDPDTLENLRRYAAAPAPLDIPEDVSDDPAALGAMQPQAAPMSAPPPSPPDGMDMATLARRFLAARQQGQREAWANHAGAIFDAAGRNILAGAGVNAAPVVQDRPGLADKPVQDLEAQTRLEMMARRSGKAATAKPGLNSDANSPEAKALQAAWKAQHPDTPPAVLATLTPANFEGWRKDYATAAEIAARKEGLTAAGERAKEQIKATATQGALNRSVRIAELKQMAEQFGASQEMRKFLAELESEDKAKAREQSEQQHTDEQAKDFGTKYEASGLPEFYANLQKAKEIVDKHASLPGTGLMAGNIPGRWVDKDAKILRGAAQQMMLAYRKSVTGTGAGEKEQEEIARATMLMQTNDDESIRLGLKMMQDIMDAKADALKAGYKPEAVDAAIGRLKNTPSVFRNAATPPRTPAARILGQDGSGQPTLDTSPARPPAPKYKPPPAGMRRVRFPGGQVRDVPANKLREAITRYNAVEVNE